MQNGATDGTPAETNVNPKDSSVLSQPQENKDQVSAKESEIANRNRDNAARRIQHKSWKQQVETANLDPEISKLAVQRAADRHGFDTKDEKNAAQANMLADAIQEDRVLRGEGERKLRVKAATETLSQTLKDIGYDSTSDAFRFAGELMFKKFGTNDPDIFADKERILKEIDDLSSAIKPRKSSDPVKEALLTKAGVPAPSAESRSGSDSQSSAEIKNFAKEKGVSEVKAKKFQELQQKLPAYARG